MAVRQRGASWQADVTIDGVRERDTFPTKEEAEAWVARRKAEAKTGRREAPERPEPKPGTRSRGPASGGSWALAEAATRCHREHWSKGACDEKQLQYIAQLEKHFGASCPLDEIDRDAIAHWIETLEDEGNSNGTINRKLACLSKILRHAVHCGKLEAMPHFNRKREVSGRIRWLTAQEEATLLHLFNLWGRPDIAETVTVMIDTGLRNGELWNLEARDVNLRNRTISVWENKTDHPRTVPMTRRVTEIVKARVQSTAPGAKLFPLGNHQLRHVWDRARSHMGLMGDKNFVPYICRHTCASRMAMKGVELLVIKEWLGHKSITMTTRYAHLSPKGLLKGVEALEGDHDEGLDEVAA